MHARRSGLAAMTLLLPGLAAAQGADGTVDEPVMETPPPIESPAPPADEGPVMTLRPAFLINTGGIWGPDEEDAPREFFVGNARAQAKGIIAPTGTNPDALGDDPHFAYFFQIEAVNRPALLDARLTGQFNRALHVSAGLTKIPISDEFLLAAGDTDFNNRARLAARLAPKRGIGVEAGGSVADGAFRYVAGVYDQNTIRGAADIPPIYAGRVDGSFAFDGGKLALGLSSGVRPSDADSDRAIYAGANARLDYGPVWVNSEVLFGGFEPESDDEDATTALGVQGTVGYRITSTLFAIARYDRLTQEEATDAAIVAALGWNPLGPILIQVDYDHPVEGEDPATLAAYGQLWVKF